MAAGGVEGVMKYTRISCSQAEAALAPDSMVDSVDSVDSAGERPRQRGLGGVNFWDRAAFRSYCKTFLSQEDR